MSTSERPRTDYVGRVISETAPDGKGWRVTYEVGVQGEQLVILGVEIRSLILEGEQTAPAGGLTAQRARELIKPGSAIREFLRAGHGDRVQASASRKGTRWHTEATPEYLRRFETLPPARKLIRPLSMLTRRQRVAYTAYLYVRAIAKGDPAPRRRVGKAQGRDEAAVRDDLHAARAESPPLLTGGGPGKVGGLLTEDAERLILQVMAPAIARAADALERIGPIGKELERRLGRHVTLNELAAWEERTGKRVTDVTVEEIVATWQEQKRRRTAPRKGGKR